MGFAEQMISSLKRNNRRKSVHTPFSQNKDSHEKSSPIKSKDFTQLEKNLLSTKLKEKKEIEREQHIYKLIISLGLTILVIGGIVFTIKIVFF